ncbi:GIY-YIG nuclease family protein [Paenibacillus sp. MMS18-CY102]|uniref:GIY-YIG nuclease family protein n=1 Tax=Paenibacillus sp. MMS18-CY102 TaxID=2682849 RepID=UPI001365B0C1|nr:GIY-YIG nuclease family protein [Paenibacillus sp. MMS18-CY102]MWC31360.1 GIY-YIG nuclease family protein [Paenibacillus sp. MMS18-CY102]
MFGTIIMDAYSKEEINQISFALDDLCAATDSYGWASSGIYCFWDYYTNEVLYIGLAVDLTERFKQHNGLLSIDPASCKFENILEYFRANEKLGFTIFVQSPLSQAVTRNNIYKWFGYDPDQFQIKDFTKDGSRDQLKVIEGILIETYRLNNGKLPPWNAVSGNVFGQRSARKENYEIVKCFTSIEPSPLTSRYSLRELSDNPVHEGYENFLHGARILMLRLSITYQEALNIIRKKDSLGIYNQLLASKYFSKKLTI